jgi:hypothetical protein
MVFERVYTMCDWYDGPRHGIAVFEGRPHVYDAEQTHGETAYVLRPIDDATLALALEDWAIWLRWEDAFHQGEAPEGSHPALFLASRAEDRARHDELARSLEAALAALPPDGVRASAEWRPAPGHETAERGRFLEVEWTRLP